MKIFREETFGPAVPLFKFGSDAEAVQLANDTEYGLAAYFYTKVGQGACREPILACSLLSHPISTMGSLIISKWACRQRPRSLRPACMSRQFWSTAAGNTEMLPMLCPQFVTYCLHSVLLRVQDLKRAWQVAEQLEYGMVGVNEVPPFSLRHAWHWPYLWPVT